MSEQRTDGLSTPQKSTSSYGKYVVFCTIQGIQHPVYFWRKRDAQKFIDSHAAASGMSAEGSLNANR
jgi:hypothetical protein